MLRLIGSLGMGGEWALGVALVMEVWPSRSRPTMAALIGAASNIGFLLIGLAGLAAAKNHEALANLLKATFPASWAEALIGPDHSFWRLLMLVGAARRC